MIDDWSGGSLLRIWKENVAGTHKERAGEGAFRQRSDTGRSTHVSIESPGEKGFSKCPQIVHGNTHHFLHIRCIAVD
jgi:hypothetical protein